MGSYWQPLNDKIKENEKKISVETVKKLINYVGFGFKKNWAFSLEIFANLTKKTYFCLKKFALGSIFFFSKIKKKFTYCEFELPGNADEILARSHGTPCIHTHLRARALFLRVTVAVIHKMFKLRWNSLQLATLRSKRMRLL